MALIAFDTHKFISRLKETGMKQEQAEVLSDTYVSVLTEQVATKPDIKALESRMDAFQEQLNKCATKEDIKALEKRMDAFQEQLNECATKEDIKAFEKRMDAFEVQLKKYAIKEEVHAIVKAEISASQIKLMIFMLTCFSALAGFLFVLQYVSSQ